MKKAGFLVALALLFLFIIGCGQPKPYKETRFLMDTIVEVTVFGMHAEKDAEAAFAAFERIDSLMNRYNPASEVSAINRLAGNQAVEVSEDTIAVLERCHYFSQVSDGAFDVTIGPLVDLWGIGKKGEFVPSGAQITEVLQKVDYRKLLINTKSRTVMLAEPNMTIDLGGVAKGYAVDKAIEVLQERGVSSALVNAGGDVRVIGTKPDGGPWHIGIQHPRKTDGLLGSIKLGRWDTLVTSGDYQRYIEKDGKRYHHIFDPKTGYPAQGAQSATIAANNSTDGDILSTLVFVLGYQRSQAVRSKLHDVQVVFVGERDEVMVTPELTNYFEFAKGEGTN